MNKEVIITMTVIGVASAVGEKVLDSMGKNNLASYLNMASVAGIGASALGIIANLIKALREI